MFKHILVPLDGSQLAETVLPAVSYIARKLNAAVTLIHIVESDAPQQVHGERHLREENEAKAYLRDVAARELKDLPDVHFHVHTDLVANVADGIAAHRQEIGNDLIIMCTHGRGGVHQWIFGTIAQQIISLGSTPVLLIQPGINDTPAPFECRGILVPLDGVAGHEHSIPAAAELGKSCHAPVHLIRVVPTYSSLSGQWVPTSRLLPKTTSQMLDAAEEEADEYLKRHEDTLRAHGVDVTRHIARGAPADIIAKAADEIGVDLIVIGTHGKIGMDAFWSGSTTPRLCHHCRIPLLLIPADHEG
jgi:nucleotide-binding universal stress UspA family protein